MNFELLRLAIALGGTSVAAYEDAKTSFIDDRITIGMLAAGIVLDLLTFDGDFIFFSVGLSAVIFGVGYLAYKTGQLGGGDVLLFAGLQALLPVFPLGIMPFLQQVYPAGIGQAVAAIAEMQLYPFFLSVFVASSLFAMIGSAVQYALALRGKKLKPDLVPLAVIAAACVIAVGWLFAAFGLSAVQVAFIALVFVPGMFLVAFKKQILAEVIIQRVPIARIEDEDVLATEAMPAGLLKKYGLGKVLTKKEVAKLRKIRAAGKMSRFPVYKNLPRFGPYILAGVIASLLFGDLFIFLLLL
ncbi:MAG: A24 family peptidase [Candidatus Micrarchaeota archaeon]